MLETIPIVKFGERPAEPAKPTDVELGDGAASRDVDPDSQGSAPQAQSLIAGAAATADGTVAADQEPSAGRRSSVGGIAAAATNGNAHDADNQGC
ncbi:hypothetical protein LTR53_020309, partial [Teratosphaeriaceae sp. CCFEE 6253]